MSSGAGESRGSRRSVLVLGATSAIARAVAEELGRDGFDLVLAGRDAEELETLARDLRLRSQSEVLVRHFEALSYDTHARFVEECREASGDRLFGAVLCFGYLGDQALAQDDFAEARRILDTNLLAAVSILNRLANHFEGRGEGFLCAISSVAGERGRQSNYLYGAAKAGLTTYLQGLRNRLSRAGVRVVTVKPGFVDTSMTFGRPGMFLVAAPEEVGRRIVDAIRKGRDVLYVPAFWRPVMLAIRSIPEKIFKKLKL
jgi:decaprenylphospho-beta-D-erythro-pentofuranosid-2-ulose 2-reductase